MNRPLDSHDRDAPIFAPDAFRLNDIQAELIGKARQFGRRVLAPRAAKHDATSRCSICCRSAS